MLTFGAIHAILDYAAEGENEHAPVIIRIPDPEYDPWRPITREYEVVAAGVEKDEAGVYRLVLNAELKR